MTKNILSMTPNERLSIIIAYIIAKGRASNQKELVEQMKTGSPAYLSNVLSGKKAVTNNLLDQLQEIEPSIIKDWVKTGKGYFTTDFFANDTTDNESEDLADSDYMEVEVVDLLTSVGRFMVHETNDLPKHKKILLPRENENGNYLVVDITDRSLEFVEYSIHEGSKVLTKEYDFKKDEKLPIHNNLFVIVTNEQAVFKQILDHNVKEGYITCHSYNPLYKDYKINTEDIIQVFIYKKVVYSRPPIPPIPPII